jgi:hypothetical protein
MSLLNGFKLNAEKVVKEKLNLAKKLELEKAIGGVLSHRANLNRVSDIKLAEDLGLTIKEQLLLCTRSTQAKYLKENGLTSLDEVQ